MDKPQDKRIDTLNVYPGGSISLPAPGLPSENFQAEISDRGSFTYGGVAVGLERRGKVPRDGVVFESF